MKKAPRSHPFSVRLDKDSAEYVRLHGGASQLFSRLIAYEREAYPLSQRILKELTKYWKKNGFSIWWVKIEDLTGILKPSEPIPAYTTELILRALMLLARQKKISWTDTATMKPVGKRWRIDKVQPTILPGTALIPVLNKHARIHAS